MTTDQDTCNDSNVKEAESSNDSKQNLEYEWIDDCFRLEQSRWKMWTSYHKNGDGLITSLTKENCISATRFYLKGLQEGWSQDDSRVVNDGFVGGKL